MKFNVKIKNNDEYKYAWIRFIVKEHDEEVFYYGERYTTYKNENNPKDVIQTWKYIELTESGMFKKNNMKWLVKELYRTAKELLERFWIEYQDFTLIETQ